MVVQVKAKVPLRDTNGNIEVPAGTIGTVLDTQFPPQELRYFVEWDFGVSTLDRWAGLDQLIFLEGPIGAVRAVFESEFPNANSIRYTDVVSETDLILGEQYTARRSRAEITFDNGLILRITSDRNTGDLAFELTSQ